MMQREKLGVIEKPLFFLCRQMGNGAALCEHITPSGPDVPWQRETTLTSGFTINDHAHAVKEWTIAILQSVKRVIFETFDAENWINTWGWISPAVKLLQLGANGKEVGHRCVFYLFWAGRLCGKAVASHAYPFPKPHGALQASNRRRRLPPLPLCIFRHLFLIQSWNTAPVSYRKSNQNRARRDRTGCFWGCNKLNQGLFWSVS